MKATKIEELLYELWEALLDEYYEYYANKNSEIIDQVNKVENLIIGWRYL